MSGNTNLSFSLVDLVSKQISRQYIGTFLLIRFNINQICLFTLPSKFPQTYEKVLVDGINKEIKTLSHRHPAQTSSSRRLDRDFSLLFYRDLFSFTVCVLGLLNFVKLRTWQVSSWCCLIRVVVWIMFMIMPYETRWYYNDQWVVVGCVPGPFVETSKQGRVEGPKSFSLWWWLKALFISRDRTLSITW